MRGLPLAARLLVFWLVAVSLVPALFGLAQSLGRAPPGLMPFVLLGALLSAVLGLLIFEPPRTRTMRGWLTQLRVRLVPSPSLPSSSTNQEQ